MRALTTFFVSVFAGAMAFIGACILPYWAGLPPEVYRANFQAIGPFIGNKMIPLMATAIALAAITGYLDAKQRRRTGMVVFLLLVLILPLYGIVHGPVNERLLGNEPLAPEIIASLRSQWAVWHWVRTALGLSALALSLYTFKQPNKAV